MNSLCCGKIFDLIKLAYLFWHFADGQSILVKVENLSAFTVRIRDVATRIDSEYFYVEISLFLKPNYLLVRFSWPQFDGLSVTT